MCVCSRSFSIHSDEDKITGVGNQNHTKNIMEGSVLLASFGKLVIIIVTCITLSSTASHHCYDGPEPVILNKDADIYIGNSCNKNSFIQNCGRNAARAGNNCNKEQKSKNNIL